MNSTSRRRSVARRAGVAVIGAALLIAGIVAADPIALTVGAAICGLGAGFLIGLLVRRPGGRRWPTGVLALVLAALLCGAAAGIPRILVNPLRSEPSWQSRIDASGMVGMVRSGHRLFVHDQQTDRVLNPKTGRQQVSAPSAGRLVVGRDHSMVQVAWGRVTYRGPDGSKRWSMRTARSPKVLAVDHGWVMLQGCRRQHEACGITPNGQIGWHSRAKDWLGNFPSHLERPSPGSDYPTVRLAPRVTAGRKTTSSPRVVMGPRGKTIEKLHGTPVGVRDKLVISWIEQGEAGTGCRLTGRSDGHKQWQTASIPCRHKRHLAAAQILAKRLYYASNKKTMMVDLQDGATHRFGKLHLLPGDNIPGIAADNVVVERDHQRLTGHDPATGKTLWHFDGASAVASANGAVVVQTAGNRRLVRLAGRDVPKNSSPHQFTVLDARTGRTTGRWQTDGGPLSSSDGLDSTYGYAPGRALVLLHNGKLKAIGAG